MIDQERLDIAARLARLKAMRPSEDLPDQKVKTFEELAYEAQIRLAALRAQLEVRRSMGSR